MDIKRVFGISLTTFAIDQASKIYVVYFLNLKEKNSINVIDPFLNFKMAWNTGINFGLFASGSDSARLILILISVTISIALLWWIRKTKNILRQVSVAFIVGGALGNTLDRIVFGAVADFINMSCCGIRNPFSFNVADMAIFLGVLLLIIWDKNDIEAN